MVRNVAVKDNQRRGVLASGHGSKVEVEGGRDRVEERGVAHCIDAICAEEGGSAVVKDVQVSGCCAEYAEDGELRCVDRTSRAQGRRHRQVVGAETVLTVSH